MDDVARAIGGSGRTVKINGKECRARPLTLKELTELERECLRLYRIEYLQRIRDSLQFISNPDDYMVTKIEESARWDVDQLPARMVYDTGSLGITESLKAWLRTSCNVADSSLKHDQNTRRITATALDQGLLTVEKLKQLTGQAVVRLETGYVNWWCTGHFDGMVTMLWLCVRDSGITRDDVEAEFRDRQGDIAAISREIESLSAPSMGNG